MRALGPLNWPAASLVDIDDVDLEAAWEATGGDAAGPPDKAGGVNPDHAPGSLAAPAVEAAR